MASTFCAFREPTGFTLICCFDLCLHGNVQQHISCQNPSWEAQGLTAFSAIAASSRHLEVFASRRGFHGLLHFHVHFRFKASQPNIEYEHYLQGEHHVPTKFKDALSFQLGFKLNAICLELLVSLIFAKEEDNSQKFSDSSRPETDRRSQSRMSVVFTVFIVKYWSHPKRIKA